MHFGKKKSQNQGASATHWERTAAALEGVAQASRTAKAATDYAEGRKAWIAALLPHFEALGVRVPYFQSLNYFLAGLANTQRDKRLELVHRVRRAVAEATEHMGALARSAEAKGASKAKKEPSKRSEYGRLAKAMTTPALMAQIESHKALLKTAEKTPETAGARRELKSELAAFEREATKRGGAPKAPKVSKAPKREPKAPKAKRAPREKKLKKPEMAARLLAHHAKEKGEKKAKCVTAARVTKVARAAFAKTKDATRDNGAALEAANEAIKKIVGKRTGAFDQETLTWTFDSQRAAKKEGETTNELLARLGFTKELTKDVPGSFGGGAHVFKDGEKLFTGTSLQVHAWLKKQADKL